MVCPVCITPPYCCAAYAVTQAMVTSGAANDIVQVRMKEKMSKITTRFKSKRNERSLQVENE